MNISGIALQGLEQSQSSFNEAASQIAKAGSSSQPGDSVDLSQAAVNLISAKNSFEANAKVMQTSDEMERATIDMLA